MRFAFAAAAAVLGMAVSSPSAGAIVYQDSGFLSNQAIDADSRGFSAALDASKLHVLDFSIELGPGEILESSYLYFGTIVWVFDPVLSVRPNDVISTGFFDQSGRTQVSIRGGNTTPCTTPGCTYWLPTIQLLGSFRIYGPEDALPALRRYSVKISAIPESSTWAMMIVGFVGVGGVMRARGRRSALEA